MATEMKAPTLATLNVHTAPPKADAPSRGRDSRGREFPITPDRPDCKYPRRADGGVAGAQIGDDAEIIACTVEVVEHEGRPRQRLILSVILGDRVKLTGDTVNTGEDNGGTVHSELANITGSAEGFIDTVTGEVIGPNLGSMRLQISGPRILPTQSMVDTISAARPVRVKGKVLQNSAEVKAGAAARKSSK